MYHSDYHERAQHITGNFPLAFYHVDESFPRYRMTMHWHEEVEFIRVIRGTLRLYLDSREFVLQPGDFCSVGGGIIHSGEPVSCEYECIVFDLASLMPPVKTCSDAVDGILHDTTFLKNSKISTDEKLKNAIEHLFETAADYQGNALQLLSCVFSVLQYLSDARGAIFSKPETVLSIRKAEQLKPALEFIERCYSQRITLEQLASLSGFSPKYFCRYFRTYAHRSPIDYLNYYRIERSAEFLQSGDENVAEVAVKCGFTDSSAFIKQFKRCKGITPKQYQLRLAEERAHESKY